VRLALDVESESFSGRFEGVLLAARRPVPRLRIQLFPDVGPKAVDLWAAPDRIAGYFGGTKEGVDCALPGEAALHPLSLMGATLLDHLAPLDAARLEGSRKSGEGWELATTSVVPGMSAVVGLDPVRGPVRRRFRWLHGVSWEWRREGPESASIEAPGLRVKARILEAKDLDRADPALLEPAMPSDVILRKGSPKGAPRR
jgi:hypothetical protein